MEERAEKKTDRTMVIAYPLHGSLYLNITNRCSNACQFCIRNSEQGVGYNLWLVKEPDVEEIIMSIGDPSKYQEVVFCGYGEPLMRPLELLEVSRWLKKYPVKVRLNTNGLSDLFLGYDILPELKGLVDTISISLNAHNAEAYLGLTRSEYGLTAYEAVLNFTRRSILYIPRVIVSVVHYPGVDMGKAAAIAKNLGVEFRIREFME